jgi:stage II sporulation protein AA (anti-sigma F factor antagonist)
MEVTSTANDGVSVLKVSGRMIFEDSLFVLREHVQKANAAGIRGFVIDLSGVPYLDSSACGELIRVHASIAKAEGSLVILAPVERVRGLLLRTGLTAVFQIVDSLEEAERRVRRHSPP